MKTVMLAGVVVLISGTAFAQSFDAFLGRDLRDRGAAIIATDRTREGFAIAQERAAEGNYVGAAVARERALIERDRADHDALAADRNRELYRLTR